MAIRPLSAAVLLGLVAMSPSAWAQLQPLEEGIAVGEWTFYPSLEARLRAEYRRDTPDASGPRYLGTSPQAEAFGSVLPDIGFRTAHVASTLMLSERARLGLQVNHDVLSAKLSLQDARLLGGRQAGFYGIFAPNEAWLDVRTSVEDPWLSVRAGRQKVRWGDGRLVGDSEWSIRGQSLDALRVQLDFGDVDVELLGALLALPLPVAASAFGSTIGTSSPDPNVAVTGAQLYGIDATWRILPLLGLELSALTRVARDPLPSDLTRGDTHTIDLRVFGEERGFEYAAEGAYQLGQVAGYGVNRDIRAFALAARAAWQTALPWHFRFGARGAYASGDDAGDASATPSDALNRFDPILPTVHEHHAKMDLYAWSNMIEAGGDVSVRPHEMLTVGAGYTFVALAEANDRWSTGYLIPIGADPSEGSQVLGSEIDAWLRVAPWDFLAFDAGYGAFVLAGRAEAILDLAGHAHDGVLHYGMLQAELIAP